MHIPWTLIVRNLGLGGALLGLPGLAAWSLDANPASDFEVARHFDYPVGPPDGTGFFIAQGFGTNFHLGEDWNGPGGASADIGLPVHAIGVGRVVFAEDAGEGWGNVVRIVHRLRHNGQDTYVESVYAHLDEIAVEQGSTVGRGVQVGTIGDAHGAYEAHLHFEVRRAPGLPLGPAYSPLSDGHLDPSAFLQAHR